MNDSHIDPKLPVRDLLARYPQLSSALAAHGLDTCCGGVHPLDQACRAKGLDAPRSPCATSNPPTAAAEAYSLVPPTMSIRELSRRFPATRPVLERYGLGDCGGEEGPEEPLAWFATVHRLPLDDFLRDVRRPPWRDVAAAPGRPPAAASAPSPFSPHFIIGSLFLTLTLGATTGMINLLRIAAGGEVPIDHRQIHGHTQVLGFATLFLMGIAYHALPRILGVGAGTRPAAPVRAELLADVRRRRCCETPANRSGSTPGGGCCRSSRPAWSWPRRLLFVAVRLRSSLRNAPEGKYDRKDPLLRFVRAGTLFFARRHGAPGAHGRLARRQRRHRPARPR